MHLVSAGALVAGVLLAGIGGQTRFVGAVSRVGDFELRLAASKRVFLSTEPAIVTASLLYVGPERAATVYVHGWRAVSFDLPSLGVALEPRGRWPCDELQLQRGVPLALAMQRPGDDAVGIRLPANVWHVSASAAIYGASCQTAPIRLSAEIKVEVRDDINVPMIDLATLREPPYLCATAAGFGLLARNPDTGLGIVGKAGGRVRNVVWPYGFTAQDDGGLAVLIGPDHAVVAVEGDRVIFGGAAGGGAFVACFGVRRLGPDEEF